MRNIFENWQIYLSEQEEVDPKRNFKIALGAIESEGYDYIANGNIIKVKHDQREEALDTLLRDLERLGFTHNIDFQGSSMGRVEIKDKTFGDVYILIKPKTKRAATIGNEYEERLAAEFNDNYGDLGISATSAGAGHGSDITVTGPNGELKIEVKTSMSADFGQFTIQYNKATGKWEPNPTAGYVKNKNIFGPLFTNFLSVWVNKNCHFPDLEDPRLRLSRDASEVKGISYSRTTGALKKELQSAWFNGKTDYKVPFDFKYIAPYYSDKGDDLIQLGRKGLFALTDEKAQQMNITKFADCGLEASLRFRLKPSMGANSSTSFTVAVKVKGSIKKSILSLNNNEDLDKILQNII